jgi:ribosomal protein S12 methylthiotransferase
MGRKITRRSIEKLIERLRDGIPHLVLRTTFIVGYPGETDSQFKELMDFVKDVQFDRLGAFIYSREEGTRAFHSAGHLPEKEKKRRFHHLMKIQQTISERKNRTLIGNEMEVLVDSKSDGDPDLLLARTQGDAPEVDQLVYLRSQTAQPGDLLKVRIIDASEYDLMAELL